MPKEIKVRFIKCLHVKEERDGYRYTQKDVALGAGVTEQTVSRWFKGDGREIESTKLATIVRLCDWLGCEIGDLVQLEQHV